MSYKSTFPSIIIADDQSIFRKGVISVIKSRNHATKIAETESGIEVVNILEKNHFDVVLMGMNLGELNGVESTSLVTQKFPQTKVIGISLYANAYHILEMFLRGASGFLLKSVRMDELIHVIKQVVSGRPHFPEEMIKKLISKENGIIQHTISHKPHIQQRLREVIFLVCMGLSSKEIASLMNISLKTIEHDRLELNRVMGSNSMAGIMKYGIMSGIVDDEKLISKYKDFLGQESKIA